MEIRVCPKCKKASYTQDGIELTKCGHCDYINTGENEHLKIRQELSGQKHLKKAKEKARELESLRVRASKIAHDFNNLLTGIIGNLSLLEEMAGKDKEIYKKVKAALKASMQAKDLTQELFTLNSEAKAVEESVVEEEAVQGIPIPAEGRVLVMDDEETIRNVAFSILTGLGYSAAAAEDGKEALKVYKEAKEKGEPFDVVIMDLTVSGGMGGKEAVKKLLKYDPEAVAIVSSGYTNSPVMKDYKLYGFKSAIAKPYGAEELLTKVYGVINN
ncbi:MAG: response regulator [Thermodesulfobacteriota bacterium]